ncbi:MAG TPA: helix-turn-helix domain-containing protein, partial [Candidatus Binatia bacterium]|nr:helix-turn-helix domain-containing protein [Candidatus Binatia bacterium]
PAPHRTPVPEPDRRFELLPLAEVEARHIRAVLVETEWRIAGPRGAAQNLGLHPNTLRSRMEKLKIRRRSA